MFVPIFYILIGFLLLVVGADYLVKGSVAIANKLNIPALIVGLTVVAFGTSVPEFVVSISSAFKGSGGIAVGNVVGSNIVNILLILGLSAAIFPVEIKRKAFVKDYIFLMLVTIVFISFALTGTFVRYMGIFMLVLLLAFIYFNYYNSKKSNISQTEDTVSDMADKSWFIVILVTVVSLGIIIFGADLLVDNAVEIAILLGISEEIIGLTIVAFGTSLPELATSAVAAYKKQSDIAIGNVLGSNIWNIVFIMGAASSIIDIDVSYQIMHFDMWVMLATSAVLLPLAYKHNKISRGAGVTLVSIYILYIILQILFAKGVI